MNKHELIAAMEAGRHTWDTLIQRIPDAEMMHPIRQGEKWSVKHIIAHIAGYEQYAAAMIEDFVGEGRFPGQHTRHLNDLFQRTLDKMRSHQPEMPAEVHLLDTPLTNELFINATRHMLPEEVVQYERDAYADLKTAILRTTEATLTLPRPELDGQTILEVLPGQSYKHYENHIPEIEVWLAEKMA